MTQISPAGLSDRSILPAVLGVSLLGGLGFCASICFLVAAGMGIHSLVDRTAESSLQPEAALTLGASVPDVVSAPEVAPLPEPEPEALASAAPLAIPVSAAQNLRAAVQDARGGAGVTRSTRSTRSEQCWRRVQGSSKRVAYDCADHPASR